MKVLADSLGRQLALEYCAEQGRVSLSMRDLLRPPASSPPARGIAGIAKQSSGAGISQRVPPSREDAWDTNRAGNWQEPMWASSRPPVFVWPGSRLERGSGYGAGKLAAGPKSGCRLASDRPLAYDPPEPLCGTHNLADRERRRRSRATR